MSRVLCLLALLAALPASALSQEVEWERFFPYEVGDRVRFRLDRNWCTAQGCQFETVHRTFEVVADGTDRAVRHGGDRWRLFRSEGDRCAVEIGEGEPWFEVHFLDDTPCLIAPLESVVGGFAKDVGYAPDVIVVGAVEYPVDAVRRIERSGEDPFDRYIFAADVGMVARLEGSLEGVNTRVTAWTLIYADVGGVIYMGVASSEAPSGLPSLAIGEAYPNPFRATATLELSLPEAATARLEVFDVLGRRVLARELGVVPAGTSAHAVDGRTLAPGLYVARVTTGSGQQATRRLVRAR